MKICSNHSEYQVPLIWTFAFNGAEYWCPYCGCNEGMLGAGENVDDTEKLWGRHAIYKKYSEFYLEARSKLVCVKFKINDGMMDRKDMPADMERELKEIANNGWKYKVRATALLREDVKELPGEYSCTWCKHLNMGDEKKRCKKAYKSDIRICKKWERDKKDEKAA